VHDERHPRPSARAHALTTIELTSGTQRATVDVVGAGLRSYSVDGTELLDGPSTGEPPRSGRGQVLIPWPNRLEDGSYEFDGVHHQLPLSEPERGNAIHGLVRRETWTVAEQEPQRVVMAYELRPQQGYPFTLALRVEYMLSAEGLAVRTTATNTGDRACPYGSGMHPYLTLGTETVDPVSLRAPGRTVQYHDARGLPLETVPVEGTEYDFRVAKPIGSTQLDHAFTDLDRDDDGRARVELGFDGRAIELWLDAAYGWLQLFTGDPLPDVARRSLSVEPMTCPANAFRSGESLVRLGPGEAHSGTWGMRTYVR
jgi:aldose 1-epimerase